MYEFIQPNDRRSTNFTSSIKTIFNEINLDDNIPGFRTLTISGRALIGRDISAIKIPGSDKQYVTENRVAEREIGVKFILKADSNEQLRERFNHLNLVLHTTEDKRLYFTDEDYHYNVILKSVTDVEETTNTIVATVKFKCIEPHKYKLNNKYVNFTGNGSFLRNIPILESVPEMITYRPNSQTNRIVITNVTTGKRIVINSDVNNSKTLKITLPAEIILKINDVAMSHHINFIETDFDFTVKNDDSISVQPAGFCEFVIKERLL